jgi:hypothetical protein
LSSSRVPNFAGRELFCFGLQVVSTILQTFYSRTVLKRTVVDFPEFLETGLAEKIAVCAHSNPSAEEVGGLEVFSYEAA